MSRFTVSIKYDNKFQALANAIIYAVLRIDNHPYQSKLTKKLCEISELMEIAAMLKTFISIYHIDKDDYSVTKKYHPNDENIYSVGLHLLMDDDKWYALRPDDDKPISIDLSWLFSPTNLSVEQKGGGGGKRTLDDRKCVGSKCTNRDFEPINCQRWTLNCSRGRCVELT